MRFANADLMVWEWNFKRFVNRSKRTCSRSRGEARAASSRASLSFNGLDGVKPRRAYWITRHYVTSKGDFFRGESDYTNAGGADRARRSAPLSLNATINPDFGGRDPDPAVEPLRRDLLRRSGPSSRKASRCSAAEATARTTTGDSNWPEPTFLYTRRIGRAPQAGFLADPGTTPLGTSILGAAKITGQIIAGLGLRHGARGHRARDRHVHGFARAGARRRGRADDATACCAACIFHKGPSRGSAS